MLSSISASAKGVPNHSVYSGSKGAVEAFARCLAVGECSPLFPHNNICIVAKFSTDFGRKGITVNAIAPGGIKTDMYIDVARKYIPNEASMTDKQIDEVRHFSPCPCQCKQVSYSLYVHLGRGVLVAPWSRWAAGGCFSRGGFLVQQGWRVDEWAGACDWGWGCSLRRDMDSMNGRFGGVSFLVR